MPNLYKDMTDSWKVTSALSANVKNTLYNTPPGLSHNNQASFRVMSEQEHLHLRTNCGEVAAVSPMHICLRSSVLQLSLLGWDVSEELEVAEPVPYNTKRNWVRVPERRHTRRHKTELSPEENRRPVMMSLLHLASTQSHFYWTLCSKSQKMPSGNL